RTLKPRYSRQVVFSRRSRKGVKAATPVDPIYGGRRTRLGECAAMSDTRTLLAKIGALRKRLEQGQGLASEARRAAAALAEGPSLPIPLDSSVREADQIDEELAAAVRTIAPAPEQASPKQLTSRARRILEKGRDLLERLRAMAGTFEPPEPDG